MTSAANPYMSADARLIAMGEAALTQGFALVGFETWPDADHETLAQVLDELVREDQRALVLLEPQLARCDCRQLHAIRAESGRIVIAEVPPLRAPLDYHPTVEELLLRTLGAHALEAPDE